METVLDAVHKDLGLTCHRIGVHAELYKLLIYEEGAFFKPHQDSEKTPGMFGTLVVCLPSRHEGGKVLLTHNKRDAEFATAEHSKFETTFAAWYSDVRHEVEKVTSGYRVVLTYNLVQHSSIPQKAPNRDTRIRVLEALKLWERASADNEPDYPPYIIHKLEHYYSKMGANINMLKGHDSAQVRCLQSACQELGYGVYLGVYEKTVRRDDDCGDEEFERDEEFEYLTELDGTKVDLCPEYDSAYRLVDDYDSADEEADESEHEGYTGNEGAPATFWYRQTVVLLVPPSRKFEFGWTVKSRYRFAPDMLRDLRPKAAEDPAAKKQLYRLCHILLPEPTSSEVWPKNSYGYDWYSSNSSEAKTCFDHILEIALEYEWLDLFGRVPMEQKTSPDGLDALGVFVFYHGAECIKNELMDMIDKAVNLADKYKLLRMITQAFRKNPVDMLDAAEHKTQFDSWYSLAFKNILKTQQRATKDDGAALGEIARTCQTDVHDQILSKLDSASTQTVVAFVLAFTRDNSRLNSPAQMDYLKKVFQKLWNNFQYAQALRTHGATVDALNGQELVEIVDLTKRYSQVSMSDVFSALSDALADVNERYIDDNLCPFVESIMSHKISSLIIEHNPELFDTVAAYIRLVLCAYIRRLVGNEPQAPKNWSLPHRGCRQGCIWCPTVNTFMADGKEKVLRYKIVEHGRKHLDSNFKYSKDAQFDITIDTSSRPYFWVCTKDHKTFKRAYPAWKAHRQEASHRLQKIGGKDMVYLKTYLGEYFDAIVLCRTEDLPDLGSKAIAEREPLSNVDSSSLNAGSNKRKINISDLVDPQDDSASKRARPEKPTPGPAEVIDLT